MASVFISYSRESHQKVRSLSSDLEALGHLAWFDQALTGGQTWWDMILSEIRKCDVFAFALEPDSLNSPACKREYAYAAQLGKCILPVLVGENVPTDLLPPALAQIQFVDYRRDDREALRALAKALTTLPSSAPLPDPLPEPPSVPVSYLGNLREQVEGPNNLSFAEQTELLLRLKNGLRNVKDAENVRTLLKYFRSRDDLYAKVADEIDVLLAEAAVAPARTKEPEVHRISEASGRTADTPVSGTRDNYERDVSGRADRPDKPKASSFRVFSLKGFVLPIILGALGVAGCVFARILPERVAGAVFVAYFFLILLIRFIQRAGHRR